MRRFHLDILATIAIMLTWTFMVWFVGSARGYENGRSDERVLQTQILIDLTTLVEDRCQ